MDEKCPRLVYVDSDSDQSNKIPCWWKKRVKPGMNIGCSGGGVTITVVFRYISEDLLGMRKNVCRRAWVGWMGGVGGV